jgi:hypothetical protein
MRTIVHPCDTMNAEMPSHVTEGDSSRSTMSAASSSEPLWTLRRHTHVVRAELRRDPRGWEVRFFSDRQWFASHVLGARTLALAYADVFYDDFVTHGWIAGAKTVHASWGE